MCMGRNDPCKPGKDDAGVAGTGPRNGPKTAKAPRRASDFERAYCRRLGHSHDASGTQLCIIDAACLDWLQSRGFALTAASALPGPAEPGAGPDQAAQAPSSRAGIDNQTRAGSPLLSYNPCAGPSLGPPSMDSEAE